MNTMKNAKTTSIVRGGVCDVTKHLTPGGTSQLIFVIPPVKLLLITSAGPVTRVWEWLLLKAWGLAALLEKIKALDVQTVPQKCVKQALNPNFPVLEPSVRQVLHVFAPYYELSHMKDASAWHCCSLMQEGARQHQALPVLISFSQPHEGARVKLIDLKSQPGEASDAVLEHLTHTTKKPDTQKNELLYMGRINTHWLWGCSKKRSESYLQETEWLHWQNLLGLAVAVHTLHVMLCRPLGIASQLTYRQSWKYTLEPRNNFNLFQDQKVAGIKACNCSENTGSKTKETEMSARSNAQL